MKPKCETCSSATKTTYERVGSKGSWQSIGNWWYCSNCDTMLQKREYPISESSDEYLHPSAAEIYPIIARVRDDLRAEFVDLQELKMAINMEKFEKYKRINIKSGFVKYHPGNFESKSPRFQPHAGWICSKCSTFILAETNAFYQDLDKDEVKALAPIHCQSKMKLGIISYFHLEERFDQPKLEIVKLLTSGNIEKAAHTFILYCLDLLANLFLKRFLKDLIYFWKNYPTLQTTLEFQLMVRFVSIFARENYSSFNYQTIEVSQVNSVKFDWIHFQADEKGINLIQNRYRDWRKLILDHFQSRLENEILQVMDFIWTIDQFALAIGEPGHYPDISGFQEVNVKFQEKVLEALKGNIITS